MKTRILDHIDLRAGERAAAQKFYACLLPALGFSGKVGDADCPTCQCPGEGPETFFCFTVDANHRPNETRIAFWAESRDELERLAGIVRQAGGQMWKDESWRWTIRQAITRSFLKTQREQTLNLLPSEPTFLRKALASARHKP